MKKTNDHALGESEVPKICNTIKVDDLTKQIIFLCIKISLMGVNNTSMEWTT